MIIELPDREGPEIDDGAWVAPTATVIGQVHLAEGASVWYGAVLRGDEDEIVLGRGSNVQDNCVMHTDPGHPVRIGADVTIGHGAIVHGATVHDGVLIGMGATLLNGSVVGSGSVIGAGALVSEGVEIPPNSLVLGVPGKVRRETTEEERAAIARSAPGYVARAQRHRGARVR
ncbi:gamma carbonic anhydrase family protein [Pseudactinotalea suaedae]|uniref:gamma carbonic anhydrase family protein n=1 Tax=Pseudactinotalea suaedae TaxID=1524924 RepID=UPI0012E213AA|nr:gamma carbonic anhydrase family protein [Pseudactinotalea suaedae]